MGGLSSASHRVLQWREDKLTFIEPSGMQRVAGGISKLASWSGIFMRKAENYNRKRTYKTAFAEMHSRLSTNADYQRALRTGEITGNKLSQEQVTNTCGIEPMSTPEIWLSVCTLIIMISPNQRY